MGIIECVACTQEVSLVFGVSVIKFTAASWILVCKLYLRHWQTFTFGVRSGIDQRQQFNEAHLIVETYSKALGSRDYLSMPLSSGHPCKEGHGMQCHQSQ